MSPKRPRRNSVVLGVLSIIAFCLFWLFLLLAANSAVTAVVQEDGRRLMASVGLGLFSFLWPIAGLVLGIIGVVKANSQKVVAGIGLALNAILLLWILINMFSRH